MIPTCWATTLARDALDVLHQAATACSDQSRWELMPRQTLSNDNSSACADQRHDIRHLTKRGAHRAQAPARTRSFGLPVNPSSKQCANQLAEAVQRGPARRTKIAKKTAPTPRQTAHSSKVGRFRAIAVLESTGRSAESSMLNLCAAAARLVDTPRQHAISAGMPRGQGNRNQFPDNQLRLPSDMLPAPGCHTAEQRSQDAARPLYRPLQTLSGVGWTHGAR
jgi:hypothetical protein